MCRFNVILLIWMLMPYKVICYDYLKQGKDWPTTYPKCASEIAQSPIDLKVPLRGNANNPPYTNVSSKREFTLKYKQIAQSKISFNKNVLLRYTIKPNTVNGK